ncbi:MAG TPA: homoserine kinase [Bryobacteraceae bacterium]|nr:homoserine kinase [Bryobacteraceae bacterium]
MAKTPPPFAITLPATSANLGPAFDAAAIALRLHLRLRAVAAPEFSIAASGRDAETCGRVEPNLVLATYREILQGEGRQPQPLALTVSNDMPIGRGAGSSAAARLAAIAMAVHFGGLKWKDDRVLAEAACRERHFDNAAACWLGGVALVYPDGALRLRARASWPLLLAVPHETLLTEHSRAVLPDCYPRPDAVANVQHAMLLAAALVEGNSGLLRHALRDRFHEPYRGPLCPLLAPLRELAAEKKGVLGAVLSGAGPSVLMVLDPAAPVEKTMRKIGARLRELGLPAELLLTSMENRGAAERRRVG